MSDLFIIPPGTPVELSILGGDGSWLSHTTTRELRPVQFYGMGLGKFTFIVDGWRIKVATKDVKGTWGRKQNEEKSCTSTSR